MGVIQKDAELGMLELRCTGGGRDSQVTRMGGGREEDIHAEGESKDDRVEGERSREVKPP